MEQTTEQPKANPPRKYQKGEVVFIRCVVMNYDYDTKRLLIGMSDDAVDSVADNGEYVLATVNKLGVVDDHSRVLWLTDTHLISLAEAKRAVRA